MSVKPGRHGFHGNGGGHTLAPGLPTGDAPTHFSHRHSAASTFSSLSDWGLEHRTESEGARQPSAWLRRRGDGQNSWAVTIFGIGPPTATRRGSRLISPDSPFAQGVTVISCILLLYTAIITPVAVAFFWENDACDPLPTLPFDIFLDTFFMTEIIYSFFVAVQQQGVYYDTLPSVAKLYIRSGSLFFDLLTSIPVAIIEFVSLQACDGVAEVSSASGATIGLRFIRIIKPLRLLKLLRIVKTMKILQMMDFVESILRPPPLLFRMLRITFTITMIVHLCACAWWLTKELSSGSETYHELGIELATPLWQKYVLSIYFINTIFTTVGFGDISAENSAEQVFCVIIMYVGVLVFGTLLAEVQAVVGELRRKTREKNQIKQQILWYLREKEASSRLEYKVMRWIDFDMSCKQDWQAERMCLDSVPQAMQEDVMHHIYGAALNNVDFLRESHPHVEWPSEDERLHVLRELSTCLKLATFCERERLFRGTEPRGLYMIIEGEVQAFCKGVRITVHTADDFFGEETLLEGVEGQAVKVPQAAKEAKDSDKRIRLKANTNVRCMLLPKADFHRFLGAYPRVRKQICGEIAKRMRQFGQDHVLVRWSLLVSKLQRHFRIRQTHVVAESDGGTSSPLGFACRSSSPASRSRASNAAGVGVRARRAGSLMLEYQQRQLQGGKKQLQRIPSGEALDVPASPPGAGSNGGGRPSDAESDRVGGAGSEGAADDDAVGTASVSSGPPTAGFGGARPMNFRAITAIKGTPAGRVSEQMHLQGGREDTSDDSVMSDDVATAPEYADQSSGGGREHEGSCSPMTKVSRRPVRVVDAEAGPAGLESLSGKVDAMEKRLAEEGESMAAFRREVREYMQRQATVTQEIQQALRSMALNNWH